MSHVVSKIVSRERESSWITKHARWDWSREFARSNCSVENYGLYLKISIILFFKFSKKKLLMCGPAVPKNNLYASIAQITSLPVELHERSAGSMDAVNGGRINVSAIVSFLYL